MLAKDIDINKAIDETFKVAESDVNGLDKFGSYAPIYLAPTSNTKETVELYTKENNNIESALVVGSQGSFAHELALNGVKKIDCFDKNILQYLYYSLFEGAICNIPYDEFIYNFTSKKMGGEQQKFEQILSDWLLYDVLDYMDPIAAEYWSRVFKSGKKNKLIASNLFRTYYRFYLESLKPISSVYDPSCYETLSYLLLTGKVNITYHICDIDEIHREFAGEKYGLMMYDNILQYYNKIPALDNIGAVNRFAKDKWANMLLPGGKIQLCYGFEIVGDAVASLLGLESNQKITDVNSFLVKRGIDRDKKEGFICGVIKKYGVGDDSPYSIDFVSPVERFDGHVNSRNVVLTYTPR